jgi:hypothetical protein
MNYKGLFCEILIAIMIVCGVASAADKVIEWKFDGNLSDSSGNGIDAVEFGGTAVYDLGVSGQALVSDGTKCAYKTGIDTALLPVLGNDTWSVNLWIYPTETPLDWRIPWCLGQKPDGLKNSRALYSSGYSGYAYGSGLITFVGKQTPDGGATGATVYTVSSIPWDINQWQMITTTYDGSIVRIYKNGTLIAMRNQTFLDAPGEVRVPSNPWNGYDFFIGKFDEFSIWRGALSQADILDLIIPSVLPNVQLNQQVVYYKMGDPVSVMPDHSGQANDGVLYGYTSPLSSWVADGFHGDALLFNGGQSINLPVSVSQPVNYTVTFWFKSGQQPYTTAFYSEKQVNNPGTGYGFGTQFIIRANNGELQVFSKERDYNTLFSFSANASAYLDGVTWNHLAVVADGEAAEARLYINGQLLGSGSYLRSSHKTSGLNASVGYSWPDDGFLGQWDPAYLDEVKIWNGALTPSQIQAVAAQSNFTNDLEVDMKDAAFVSGGWLLNDQNSPGEILIVDDMEGSLDAWSVIDGYNGAYGTVSQTTNAYTGSGALRWEYELPATADPNKFYTSIRFDLGETKDLSMYDKLSLRLYRHAENTPQDLLYLKFYTANIIDPNVKAEAWIDRADCVEEPAEEWSQWQIDLSNLRGHQGQGTASQEDLTDIRYILIGTGSQDRTEAGSGMIDMDEFVFVKDPTCFGKPEADLNGDCKVDIQDLLYIVDEWLLGV